MARRVPRSLSALAVPAERQRGDQSPRLPLLSVTGLEAAASCRAGKQALTERDSVRQPGKGKYQAPGSGRGVLSPVTGFHPWQPCPGQQAVCAAREANTRIPAASAELQAWPRPESEGDPLHAGPAPGGGRPA